MYQALGPETVTWEELLISWYMHESQKRKKEKNASCSYPKVNLFSSRSLTFGRWNFPPSLRLPITSLHVIHTSCPRWPMARLPPTNASTTHKCAIFSQRSCFINKPLGKICLSSSLQCFFVPVRVPACVCYALSLFPYHYPRKSFVFVFIDAVKKKQELAWVFRDRGKRKLSAADAQAHLFKLAMKEN